MTYVSVYKADRFRDVPHFASTVAVENALREFGVPFTILRPGYFFQNDLTVKPLMEQMGIYPMPIGRRVSPPSTRAIWPKRPLSACGLRPGRSNLRSCEFIPDQRTWQRSTLEQSAR